MIVFVDIIAYTSYGYSMVHFVLFKLVEVCVNKAMIILL